MKVRTSPCHQLWPAIYLLPVRLLPTGPAVRTMQCLSPLAKDSSNHGRPACSDSEGKTWAASDYHPNKAPEIELPLANTEPRKSPAEENLTQHLRSFADWLAFSGRFQKGQRIQPKKSVWPSWGISPHARQAAGHAEGENSLDLLNLLLAPASTSPLARARPHQPCWATGSSGEAAATRWGQQHGQHRLWRNMDGWDTGEERW